MSIPFELRLSLCSLSLLLLGLSACSGSATGGPTSGPPPPPPGPPPGAGAASDYVFFVGRSTPTGTGRPYAAALDGSQLRDLSALVLQQNVLLGGPSTVSVSPDGAHVAINSVSASNVNPWVIDVANGVSAQLPSTSVGAPANVGYAWSPDSTRLGCFFGGAGGTFFGIYDHASGQLLPTSPTLAQSSPPLTWSTDGSAVALRSFVEGPLRTTLDVFDRDGNALGSVLPAGLEVHGARYVFGPGRLAFAAEVPGPGQSAISSSLWQFDLAAMTSSQSAPGTPSVGDPLYSPDGQWLSYIDNLSDPADGNQLMVIDALRGGAPLNLSGGFPQSYSTAASWSPASDRVAWVVTQVSGPAPRRIVIADTVGAQRIFEAPAQSNIGGHVWSPSGDRLAWATYSDGSIYVLDIASGGPPLRITSSAAGSSVGDLVWTPDGQRLLWRAIQLGESSLQAWLVGTAPTGLRIGESVSGPLMSEERGPLYPTSDSSAVVWVKREAGTDLNGVVVTPFADPLAARVVSSPTGDLDLVGIAWMAVR